MTDAAVLAPAVLTIDLEAIAANWRLLSEQASPAECAGVVKANAYGLGAERVAPALAAVGCRHFFVATLDEGIELRRCLAALPAPAAGGGNGNGGAAIYLLNGTPEGGEGECVRHGLQPVLNGLADIARWKAFAHARGSTLPAAVHVDTGMSRLGLPTAELAILADEPDRLAGIVVTLVMSHLACADEPVHPLNHRQRDAFATAAGRLPPAPRSLANSSGIMLGSAYHFDLVRPGAALYGVAPTPSAANPMRPVVRLSAKILQVRQIDTPETVGYGASYQAGGTARIATVSVGYADGYLRSLGNRARGTLADRRVPLVGRVSMDLITFDVTTVPPASASPGAMIELIGDDYTIDAIAADAGTIGYEILTALGPRYHRVYRGGGEPPC